MAVMIVIGVDAHKRTHTCAAVQALTGQKIQTRAVAARDEGLGAVHAWARELDDERVWAIEDCRHVSGRLERFLIARGERVVRVAPRLTGPSRRGEREPGKSDPIDAVAIARAAIREGVDTLPSAHLDERALEIRQLAAHRERLVGQRTALINDLRWQLHDIDPEFEVPARRFTQINWQARTADKLTALPTRARVRVALDELARIRELTGAIASLEAEVHQLVRDYRPALLSWAGCGPVTAAKVIGETAGAERFPTPAKFARITGTAPIPASSGNRVRHRLDPGGNRQLNAALHRIAITQIRVHPPAKTYLQKKLAEGKTHKEAVRCLKRQLAGTLWRLLLPTPPNTADPTEPPNLRTRRPNRRRTPTTIHCNPPVTSPNLT
jgi:transposase